MCVVPIKEQYIYFIRTKIYSLFVLAGCSAHMLPKGAASKLVGH